MKRLKSFLRANSFFKEEFRVEKQWLDLVSVEFHDEQTRVLRRCYIFFQIRIHVLEFWRKFVCSPPLHRDISWHPWRQLSLGCFGTAAGRTPNFCTGAHRSISQSHLLYCPFFSFFGGENPNLITGLMDGGDPPFLCSQWSGWIFLSLYTNTCPKVGFTTHTQHCRTGPQRVLLRRGHLWHHPSASHCFGSSMYSFSQVFWDQTSLTFDLVHVWTG